MRTTVDIDAPVLRDLKRLQKQTRQSLGRLISDLLVDALASRKSHRAARPEFRWVSKQMHARIDLEDKEAVWRALDRGAPGRAGE